MVKYMDSGTLMLGFESWLYHYVTLKGPFNFCVPLCFQLKNRDSNKTYSYYN